MTFSFTYPILILTSRVFRVFVYPFTLILFTYSGSDFPLSVDTINNGNGMSSSLLVPKARTSSVSDRNSGIRLIKCKDFESENSETSHSSHCHRCGVLVDDSGIYSTMYLTSIVPRTVFYVILYNRYNVTMTPNNYPVVRLYLVVFVNRSR